DTPKIEKSRKGPKDAFVETLRTNTALIRRHLRNADLKITETKVGKRSNTAVAICYISGITDMALVNEMQRRVDAIDIDGLISPGNLEEYLLDRPRSPAPQALHTERPDRFCLNLLEGRVGVLVDGIPHALLMPVNFHQFFKFPEDNAYHFFAGSMLMVLRYIALILSTLFPAVAVAVTMYHQEMIPTKLLLSMIGNAQQVPFSVATEVLGLLLAFLLLQEAQTRLPTPVGDTISLIGALILGQAAVEANIVSPISVIIFAAAAIAGYTAGDMDLSMACRIIRVIMVIVAIFTGLFGVMAALILIFHHLSGLTSLGAPYMVPATDGQQKGFWRLVPRAPLRRKKYRPESLNTGDRRNQG
ncbi:MAG: spore germination protein, partial [Firmicutes bacterium]|nr:spore germination protein [Bacillota bacterium]